MQRFIRTMTAVTVVLAGILGETQRAGAQYACGGTVGPNAGIVVATMSLGCMTGATPALTVVGPGTTLNFDGFAIGCSATNVCLQVNGEKAIVKNGFVSGGTVNAVAVGGTGKHKIENLVAEASADHGLRVASPKNKLINCVSANNANRGFSIDIGGNKIDSCSASYNGTDGFFFGDVGDTVIRSSAYLNDDDGFDTTFGPTKFSLCVAAHNDENGFEIGGTGSKLVKNTALGNNVMTGFAGFYVTANDSTLVKNIADSNNNSGFTVTGDFNKFSKNRATSNMGWGILLMMTADSNTLSGNLAMRNLGATDVADDGGCGTTTWSKNVFVTTSDPCIQ